MAGLCVEENHIYAANEAVYEMKIIIENVQQNTDEILREVETGCKFRVSAK
jgi:hypothetical protein